MNLALWLWRTAQTQGDAPALAQGLVLTHRYRQLADAAASGAAWWQAQGLQAGDRVGLFMGNATAYVVTQWAVWWAGGVVVPINARLHGREAAYILEHSGARWCVVDAAHDSELAAHLPRACERLHSPAWAHAQPAQAQPVHEADEGAVAASLQPFGLVSPVPRQWDDPAWLFYTSGTTGRPKGVCLSMRNLQQMALAYTATVQAVAPGQVCLHPAPLSHGSGLYHLPYVMNAGLNVVPASGGLDEAELFELAAHWQQCSLFAAPTIIKRLAAFARRMGHPPKGFSTMVYGGAPMYVADVMEAHQALGPVLAQIYGQGESPMTITVLPRHLINDTTHPQWRQRLASVGFAQPMVEVSVRDAAGHDLPVGTVGEVCVRGDVVMQAYWNNPEATAAALREGWLATGDVGYMDAQGLLTLLDRSKDLVISGGNNIYPREIEEVLLQHPAVDEVAVIGIPHPEWGEALVAYVVATPDQPPPTAEMLEAHCLAHIARYKRPKVWRWVSALPKNNYGKVLKTELREWERQGDRKASHV